MKKPKTLKGFLKMLSCMANTATDELKGIDKLTQEEKRRLTDAIGSLQNDLGDVDVLDPILDKFGIKWESENII